MNTHQHLRGAYTSTGDAARIASKIPVPLDDFARAVLVEVLETAAKHGDHALNEQAASILWRSAELRRVTDPQHRN